MSKAKLKSTLICRGCGAEWPYVGVTAYTKCPYCDRKIDARDRAGEKSTKIRDSESFKKWRSDPNNVRRGSQLNHDSVRRRAFFKICGSATPRCIRCGCDDLRLLEINHKNACSADTGRHRIRSGHSFCRLIINGSRPVDDLEILCRPCNAIHYLEHKCGGTLPIKVIWYGGGKHGEPESIDWMDSAYDLDCKEEQKMVTVRTFEKKNP